MTGPQDTMEEKIKAYLSTKIPHGGEIRFTNFTQMTEGFSYETYMIHAEWVEQGKPLSQGFAIRMMPEAGAVEPYDIDAHYKIMKVVEDTPVPSPKLYWLEKNNPPLGRPFFVMEKVEGEVPIPWNFKDHPIFQEPEKRRHMARNLIQVLADYQAIDWRKCADFLPVPQEETDPARMEIERWERNIENLKIVPQPLLREVSFWLKRNMPKTPFFTLTHGDFRLGNFIWRDNRIVAFLDWEMPGIGDPMMDVAWICLKIMRGDRPDLMCMLVEREEIYRIYEELTGTKVDKERVFYWEVMAYYKLASIFISAIRAFGDGKNRDVRLVSIVDSSHYACLRELSTLLGW